MTLNGAEQAAERYAAAQEKIRAGREPVSEWNA
jgi:hypothetical protein